MSATSQVSERYPSVSVWPAAYSAKLRRWAMIRGFAAVNGEPGCQLRRLVRGW